MNTHHIETNKIKLFIPRLPTDVTVTIADWTESGYSAMLLYTNSKYVIFSILKYRGLKSYEIMDKFDSLVTEAIVVKHQGRLMKVKVFKMNISVDEANNFCGR